MLHFSYSSSSIIFQGRTNLCNGSSSSAVFWTLYLFEHGQRKHTPFMVPVKEVHISVRRALNDMSEVFSACPSTSTLATAPLGTLCREGVKMKQPNLVWEANATPHRLQHSQRIFIRGNLVKYFLEQRLLRCSQSLVERRTLAIGVRFTFQSAAVTCSLFRKSVQYLEWPLRMCAVTGFPLKGPGARLEFSGVAQGSRQDWATSQPPRVRVESRVCVEGCSTRRHK